MSEVEEEKWYGRRGGNECSVHDSLGRRAWCSACSEYCSPLTPCRGCEMPELRAEIQRLREAIGVEFPRVGSGYCMDESCFFCGGDRTWGTEDDPLRHGHAADCIWVEVRQSLKGREEP